MLLDKFTQILEHWSAWFWSGPLLLLLVFVGLLQTIRLRGLQFRYLGHAFKLVLAMGVGKEDKTQTKLQNEIKDSPDKNSDKNSDKNKKGDISSFQALMTALAGAIGTGNITGIATAVVIGGFGALFWMWCIALLGMATAYSEAVLAVRYRIENKDGGMSGGPMYTLLNGLKARKMAIAFALFGACAALGLGALVQSNSVVDAVNVLWPGYRLMTGIILAVVVGAVTLGGIQSIGRVAGVFVPLMGILYLLAGLIVLVLNYQVLPQALQTIVVSAFTGQAAMGGFAGATWIIAIQMGASNGIFANEAGLGSLSIAAASAKVNYPARQGMFAICGVFLSTMVVCTVTGLVLAVTNVLGAQLGGEIVSGSPLAMLAFSTVHSGFQYVVLIGLILFAFTTILAWEYYGEKCCEFLFGLRVAYGYRWFYLVAVILGAVLSLNLVWALAHFMNALMALPNLYSIIRLSPEVSRQTKEYCEHLKAIKAIEVKSANVV